MNKLLILGFALVLGSMGCGDDKDTSNPGTGVGTGTGTGSGSCQGANSKALVGSCTLMGQCFEEYAPTAPSADIVKTVADSCASFGAWSTGKCAIPTVGCTCTDTTSTYRMVTYFSEASMCSDCTGACESVN